MVPLRAPKVNVEDACFFSEDAPPGLAESSKGGRSFGVQLPTDLLQTTVMDYTFKINILAGAQDRGVLPLVYDDDGNDDGGLDVSGSGFGSGSGSGCGSDSDSDSGAPPAATTSS
jgi:hypothetical protein